MCKALENESLMWYNKVGYACPALFCVFRKGSDILRRLRLAALCVASVLFTGCSALNFSVEGLVDAPKLTKEQAEIHQALIESVGSNITLKYPRNGDYRSAYVIANIDDEPDNEAIVFYEYKEGSKDNGMRINVLDTDDDGDWHSVKELHGAGTDIDKVMISSFGWSSEKKVLVGYQNPATDDKTLEIYRYSGGKFEKAGTDTYSILEMMDINADGMNELVAVQKTVNPETEKVTAKASILTLENGEVKREQTIDMCDNVTAYVKSTKGMLDGGRSAVFIDSLNAEGLLQTELVYYRYSTLQNPIQQRKEKLLAVGTRPSGYYCMDMDGDTILEIPTTKPMLGYENAVADEMLYMTTWNVYKDFYTLEEKYTGYYSIQNGFFLAYPKRWLGKVTVRRDDETGDVVYYKYSGNINTSNTELVRFCSVTKNNSEEKIRKGYELVDSRGQLQYFVKFPKDSDDQLVLTIDEVKNNFYIID